MEQVYCLKQALEKAFDRKRLELDAQQQHEEDEQHQSELSAELANMVDNEEANAEDDKKSEREKHNEIVSLAFFEIYEFLKLFTILRMFLYHYIFTFACKSLFLCMNSQFLEYDSARWEKRFLTCFDTFNLVALLQAA